MRFLKYTFFLLLLLAANIAVAATASFKFFSTTIVVADSVQGGALLGKDDGYAKNFSLFDIQSKTRVLTNTVPAAYYRHAAKQSLSWTDDEVKQVMSSFTTIADTLRKKGIALNLPQKIYIIKSTMMEEYGAAGYTRGDNIVLKGGEEVSAGIMSHELFHVYSRFNPKKRDELYNVFGFKKCNPIVLNKAMDNLNITNPDCPVIEHYLPLAAGDVALTIYSNRPYAGGEVFTEYLKVGAVVLEGGDTDKKVKTENGKAVIKDLQNLVELFARVGQNTPYIIHIEEICAEHFSMLCTGKQVREPEFLNKFTAVLKK